MKTPKLIAITAAVLLLAGCSAGKSGTALDACVSAAIEEVGADITTNDLESTNMGDALYEAGITDEKQTDDDDAMFTVAGKFTYQKDGTEVRKSMVCTIKFTDGQAGEPDLALS